MLFLLFCGVFENATFAFAQSIHAFFGDAIKNSVNLLLGIAAFFVFGIILESLAWLVRGCSDLDGWQMLEPFVASHPQDESKHQGVG